MPSYLERYRQGDHEAVWDELTQFGAALATDASLTADAVAVAELTMTRAAQNVDHIVAKLHACQYHFAPIVRPRRRPVRAVHTHVRDMETQIGALPLSIKSWMQLVGCVNLMGQLPPDNRFHEQWPTDTLADPLVFDYTLRSVRDEYREWTMWVAEEGIEQVGAFKFAFAPDDYHKDDISGGAPYSIQVPNPAADAPVEDAWHQTTFVRYLRICFQWGGFPGFSRSTAAPLHFITYLTHDLIPL